MSNATDRKWQREFGIEDADSARFFASKAALDAAESRASQSHILRRAFDLLKLDGILCADSAPLVYFKKVKRIDAGDVVRLHRTFWNHGAAPILVLIAPDTVHVYSGLAAPSAEVDDATQAPSFVESLNRVSSDLTKFLTAVESGEYFRRHSRSFDPAQRVDRNLLDNLNATRQQLIAVTEAGRDSNVLDALLCRLVFMCYLFDRSVIGQNYLAAVGVKSANHLRDLLGIRPRSKAKAHLYDLFNTLGQDFNGDLFSDDLVAEAKSISESHIESLDEFFRATDTRTGQRSFWPYDFAAIPIETISAIYERFLKNSKGNIGAFYTPRFLAEVVLDTGLSSLPSLLGRRYLDPACGSGIFLVGLFNRMAEEWKRANPRARNDRRARELRTLLCDSLYGVDINPTACRITAFSLYLAYLDQLSPRDIQDLRHKGTKLPKLVHYSKSATAELVEGNVWCADFFADRQANFPPVDLVIGNPPWGSEVADDSPAAQWCKLNDWAIPDRQIAAAFVAKAATHLATDGRCCLVLPHGILFNHRPTALNFQKSLFTRFAVDHVLNLADYRFFLFEEARHPALVITYSGDPPQNLQHRIQYWTPKTEWMIFQAETVTVAPDDRTTFPVESVLSDLEGNDAPQIWKRRFWATSRDFRLLERLSLYSRLRDQVRSPREREVRKLWIRAEGFQPVGENDDPAKAKTIQLPSRLFIEATTRDLDLFLLRSDCLSLPASRFTVRSGSNTATDVFRAPHVIVAQGFTKAAYADFDVSFRHALRGISGPAADRDLLIFLSAYLRSTLAKYFLFQTSSNWGIGRPKVHFEELLRLPFPRPEAMPRPDHSRTVVANVARIVTSATAQATEDPVDRARLVLDASQSIEPLLDEYFDILPEERVLIDDTMRVIIPSVQPARNRRRPIPTIVPSNQEHREKYVKRLTGTLNRWAASGQYVVRGAASASQELGVGVAVLEKTIAGQPVRSHPDVDSDLLPTLHRLRSAASTAYSRFELLRGTKVFDGNCLYIVKPIGQRYWTETAALNDADEIAGTILMHSAQGATWR